MPVWRIVGFGGMRVYARAVQAHKEPLQAMLGDDHSGEIPRDLMRVSDGVAAEDAVGAAADTRAQEHAMSAHEVEARVQKMLAIAKRCSGQFPDFAAVDHGDLLHGADGLPK